eukprot:m.355903 g.355903  ORF g.355903 m.355903 type:complete len:506 (-) comp17382_c0_seq1:257-1774(-)
MALLRRAVARCVNQSHCRVLSSTVATSRKELVHAYPLDHAVVEEALQDGVDAQCPFLAHVKTELQDPAVQGAIESSQESATQALKSVIDRSLTQTLLDLKRNKRYRDFFYFKRLVGQHPQISGNTLTQGDAMAAAALSMMPNMVTNWCSNDYLNMGHHPAVLQAINEALYTQGAGAGGTRNISGSNILHNELERELAFLSGSESSLLFTSCYNANLGVMEALGSVLTDAVVLSDAENHASLIEGIKHSRLPKQIFKHNDLQDLESQLAALPDSTTKIVVFESVYSMSGTLAPVKEILDLCHKYGAFSVLDEVHAVGIYGQRGGGILDMLEQHGRADIVTGTLGKAFGISGGFVASSAQMIDVIRSTSPSFIFTTALSPLIAAGALASVRHVMSVPEERQAMLNTAASLKKRMLAANLPLMSTETHIMPLHVGEGDLCKQMSRELFQRGIYVQPINYPSVPKGGDLLRLTASPRHTEAMCDDLMQNLVEVFESHDMLGPYTEAHTA